MSPVRIDNFTVCRVCAGLAGSPRRESHPQVCRCRRQEQERWPHHDFNEYVDLCWCCGLERIPSGSKWSSFYCPQCRELVTGYNHSFGRLLLYLGRHSLMNGVWLGGDQAARPEAVEGFGEAMGGFARGILGFFEAMDRWRPARLQVVLQAIGLEAPGEEEPPGVSLVEYLDVPRALLDHPEVGKQAAFGALCEFLGYPAAEEAI